MKLTNLIKPKSTASSQTDNPNPTKSKIISASFQKKFKFTKKIKYIILSVVIVLVLLFGFVIVTHLRNSSNIAVCTQSNPGLLKQAQTSISNNNYSQLLNVVNKIKALNNYTKDPNCLYPIAYYYVYTGNINQSKHNLVLLKKVYKPKQGFSKIFTSPISIKVLNAEVSVLDFNAQHLNVFLINQPGGVNKTK